MKIKKSIPKLVMHIINMDNYENMVRLLSFTDGYFDHIRICDGGTKNPDVWTLYKRYGCETYIRTWDDNMSAQHNLLMSKAKKDEWVLIMDSDECPTKQLLKAIKNQYIVSDYDIYKIPSIMAINGITDWTVKGLINAINDGDQKDRFGKWILFRNNGKVEFSGTSHYGLTPETTADWNHHELVPEPYIHYKEPIDVVKCDVQQAWIKPDFQGVPEEYCDSLHNLGKYNTSRELLLALKHDTIDNDARYYLWNHRETPGLNRFFQLYYLYYHPERLKQILITDEEIQQALIDLPIFKQHLRELGGYKSRAFWGSLNGEHGEWLPIDHLPVHPQLMACLNKAHILLRRSEDE